MRLCVRFGSLALCFLTSVPALADDAAIKQLVDALDSATGNELYAAVDRLADHGAAAKPAVTKLAGMLGDEDAELRWRAARTLGAIGAPAAVAAPALAEKLTDEIAKVRAHAAYALGHFGAAAKPLAPQIVELVADEDPLVRRAALRSLQLLKPDRKITIPLFAKILQSSDKETVTAVLHSMAEMGADAVPALNDALDHQDGCFWATLVIQEIGEPAKALVPKLTKLVADEDEPELRMHAILALGAIGPAAKSAVPAIIKQFTDDEHNAIRYAGAYALGKMGAVEAKHVLQDAVTNNAGEKGDAFLRVTAAAALAKLFPNDEAIEKQSVDVMLAGLTSKDANVRRAAVQAMAESKAPSDLTQPKLVEMIKDADPQLIGDIIGNLTALGADAVPRVKRGLANPDLRGYAAVILGNIGPAAKDAVPELVKALDVADDPDFRREVLYTLGRIGAASAPAAAKIVEILKTDKNERVISAACYAAGSIGPPATDAAPALVGLYNDGTDFQKMLAIWALLKVRPGHESIVKRAVPLMTKGLSHERDDVRIEAAMALGDIGAPAASALPELRKLLDNPSDAVRKAAQEAMAKIQK